MKRIAIVLATSALLVLPTASVSSEGLMPFEIYDGGGGGGQCSPRVTKDLGLHPPAGIVRAGSSSPGFSAPQQALTGDIDGNGTSDLIVAGPAANAKRYVAVFFDATLSSLNSRSFSSADYKILSPKQYPWQGDVVKSHQMQWLAVADVNNDQFDDIVFSMPTIYLGRDALNNVLRDNRGEVYVVLGNTRSNLGAIRDLASQPADFTFVGADPGDMAGFGLGTGDINADGQDDIIIGAWQADGPGNAFVDGGEVYVITSIDYSQRSMVLSQSTVNLYLYGEAGEKYGYAVAAGNLNGDAASCPSKPYDDVIVAPFKSGNGPVKAVFGSSAVSGTKRLSTDANWTSAYTLVPRAPNLLVGDVNHDRIDDLVATDAASGVFITYGRATGLATQADARVIKTINIGDNFGFAAAIADVDGDLFNDLAIVAPRSLGATSQYTLPVGELHVVWGQPGGFAGTIDLKTESTHFSLYGSDGTGVTGLMSNFQGHWNSTYGYTFGKDLDGDGRAEFFFGGNWFQDTYVYKASR